MAARGRERRSVWYPATAVSPRAGTEGKTNKGDCTYQFIEL